MSFMLRLSRDTITGWVVVRTILLNLELLHDFNLNNLTSVQAEHGRYLVVQLIQVRV